METYQIYVARSQHSVPWRASIRVQAESHRQHVHHETTLVGVPAYDTERLAKLLSQATASGKELWVRAGVGSNPIRLAGWEKHETKV